MGLSEGGETPKELRKSNAFTFPSLLFQSAPFCVKGGVVRP